MGGKRKRHECEEFVSKFIDLPHVACNNCMELVSDQMDQELEWKKSRHQHPGHSPHRSQAKHLDDNPSQTSLPRLSNPSIAAIRTSQPDLLPERIPRGGRLLSDAEGLDNFNIGKAEYPALQGALPLPASPNAHSSNSSTCSLKMGSTEQGKLRLAIPQSWVGYLMGRGQSPHKCRLQQIREEAELDNCTVRLVDGKDRTTRLLYRIVEVSSGFGGMNRTPTGVKILIGIAGLAKSQNDCKVYLVTKKGEAGAIIGKGGEDIRNKRMEYRDTAAIKIIQAKSELQENCACQAGVDESDEAIRLEGKTSAVLELLHDFSKKIMHFQELNGSNSSSASPALTHGSPARRDVPAHYTPSKLVEQLRKESCSLVMSMLIDKRQKDKLMRNRAEMMLQLRKEYEPIYLKLIDDDARRPDGMRTIEIGGRTHQSASVDRIRDHICAL